MTVRWVRSSEAGVDYPASPWQMVGSMWLSVFRLGVGVDERRPPGVYGAAWVSYDQGSPLTYAELLVARPVSGRKDVTVTDIWVDSPQSVAGGRELWAIPKELCSFTRSTSARGPLSDTTWSASGADALIAKARFADVSRFALRAPFKGGVWQPGIADTDGEDRTSTMAGSAKTLPCRGVWEFAPDGPLAWLAGARQLGSVRMAGFRMAFT